MPRVCGSTVSAGQARPYRNLQHYAGDAKAPGAADDVDQNRMWVDELRV